MHHAESVPEQKKPSSSSANVIGQNDDLLTEILLLLPAKSLIRFKLVSKQWHSLISAASFCRLHILNHSRRHRCNPQHSFILGTTFWQYFVCDPTFKKLTRLHFPFANDIIIEQSCNGLLLLRSLDICSYNYFIFNPTTMHHRKLFRFLKSRYAVSLHLLFDPSRSPHYKVIRFQRWADSPDQVYFYEYDSATHEWTDCGRSQIPNTPWQFFYNSVSCNNRVYYIINGMSIAPFYYSADEKRVCLIQSSPNDEARGISKCIMESNGHVHYVHLSRMAANPSLDVYEMIDNEWVHCKSADQEQLKVALDDFFGLRNYVPELLGMMREERLEDSFVLVRVPGQIVLYSFSDKEDFRSHYFYEYHGPLSFVTAFTFIESFVTV